MKVFKNQKQELKVKINSYILSSNIRIVGSKDSDGTYTRNEALQIANAKATDLIEINVANGQSICKLMDLSKYLYELKQKEKQKIKGQKSSEVKEIRMGPDISVNDIAYRIKNAIEFLKDGNKVKLSIKFTGRQMKFTDKGQLILLQFADAVKEHGILENMPKMEGKNMNCFIKPKK